MIMSVGRWQADRIDAGAAGIRDSAGLWTSAVDMLGRQADHTEIYRYLADTGRTKG